MAGDETPKDEIFVNVFLIFGKECVIEKLRINYLYLHK